MRRILEQAKERLAKLNKEQPIDEIEAECQQVDQRLRGMQGGKASQTQYEMTDTDEGGRTCISG